MPIPAGVAAAHRVPATADGMPTLAEARHRLAQWKAKPSCLLMPEALNAGWDLPEMLGSVTYHAAPRRAGCIAPLRYSSYFAPSAAQSLAT